MKIRWGKNKTATKPDVNPKPTRVTACCEEPIAMREVGQELYAVCSGCNQYLGHIVIRPVAVLVSHFRGFITKAATERRLETTFSPLELDEMFEKYLEYLTDWAPEAARQALKEYVPFEEKRK